jgi:cell division protein FtsL
MGLPAVRHEREQPADRPSLRVVRPPRKSPAGQPRKAGSGAYQVFVIFTSVLLMVAVMGLGRIWLSVEAARTSIEAGKLRTAIKAAQYQGDMLEIQQSALSTPSRIQALAVGTMGMAPATSVSYLRLQKPRTVVQSEAVGAKTSTPHSASVVQQAMNVAAGEARMLLVGDAGLASSK